MSIYPVKLSEWFPPGDEQYVIASSIVSCTRCLACGKRVRYKAAVGHHALPWGYGDLWCSWKCCRSGETARPDKRRERRLRRKYGRMGWLDKRISVYPERILLENNVPVVSDTTSVDGARREISEGQSEGNTNVSGTV